MNLPMSAYQRATPVETRQIESAKKLLASLDAIDKVYADSRFWIRRIKRALRRGGAYATSSLSFCGDVSPEYLEQLEKALHRISPMFRVTRTYYEDPLGLFEPVVVVYWSAGDAPKTRRERLAARWSLFAGRYLYGIVW